MISILKRRRSAGFSLIEILIVVALMSFIVLLIAQRMSGGNKNREMRKEVRDFASDMRRLRNKARMQHRTYRLVINLPENKEEAQAYWTESTSRPALITYDEDLLKKQQEEAKDKGKGDPSGFDIDKQLSPKGPSSLPKGLYFDSVEVAAQKKEYTSGRLFIHFFPDGRVEEVVVHLTDRKKVHFSLAVHPLTGRVDIVPGNKKLKDL